MLICLNSVSIAAEKPARTFGILGASATVGPRGGLGVSTGLARATCGELGCHGYGLVLNNRFGMHYTASLEAGTGFFVMLVPAYAGIGVRAKDGRTSGGQLSFGTGAGPVLGLITIYSANSKIGAEFGLSANLPIPIGTKEF